MEGYLMSKKHKVRLTPEKKNVIANLIEMYDIKTTGDLQGTSVHLRTYLAVHAYSGTSGRQNRKYPDRVPAISGHPKPLVTSIPLPLSSINHF